MASLKSLKNDDILSRWRSAITKKKIFQAVTVTVGKKKLPPRSDQASELERWLTADHDPDWLVVANPSGIPLHFISSDGKINKLALAVDERSLWFWASDSREW
jgi:hypothetical protein